MPSKTFTVATRVQKDSNLASFVIARKGQGFVDKLVS